MASRRSKSVYESRSVKINKARPAPDFTKLHNQWQDKFNEGKSKSKKPSTVPHERPSAIPVPTKSLKKSKTPSASSVLTETSAAKPCGSTRKTLIRKKLTDQTDHNIDFKADPDSLAAILGNKPEKVEPKPRLSVYDKWAIAQQTVEIESDYAKMFTATSKRTPLKDVDNVSSSYRDAFTPRSTRKSVYDVLSAKQMAQASAVKTAEKLKAHQNRNVTWSVKLAQCQRASQPEDPLPKLKLSESAEEELDESMLQKIKFAEQMIEKEIGAISKTKNDAMNATYITRPNRDDTLNMFGQENVASVLGDTINPVERPFNKPRSDSPSEHEILPQITGVSRLPVTPAHDDTIANLFDNLCLGSQSAHTGSTLDGSPVLSMLTRNRARVPAEQMNTSYKHHNVHSASILAGSTDLVDETRSPDITVEALSNLSAIKAAALFNEPNTEADDSSLVSKPASSRLISTDNKTNTHVVVKNELCSSIQSVDELIAKSRRRSATIVAAGTCNTDMSVKKALELILAQQHLLDQRKRTLQERLNCIENGNVNSKHTVSPQQDITVSSKSALVESSGTDREVSNLAVQTAASQSSTDIKDSHNISSDSKAFITDTILEESIVSGASDRFRLSVLLNGDDTDMSFMPPPFEIADNSGLRAISTAALKADRRSKVRESLNLMLFSPTLHNIQEKSATVASGEISHSNQNPKSERTLTRSNAIESDGISQLSGKKPSLTESGLNESMDVTEPPPHFTDGSSPCSGGVQRLVEVPAITTINHVQGCHLLSSGQEVPISISPRTLHSQSQLISSIDCIQNGLPSEHYQTLLNRLELKHQINQTKDDRLFQQSPDKINTPRITYSGGTIKLNSSDCSPQFTKVQENQNDSDTSDLLIRCRRRIDQATREIEASFSVTGKYKEGLLDDEVSIYMCTSTSSSAEKGRRKLSDPVAYSLEHGDSRHFVPIPVDGSRELKPADGSAFSLLPS